jgi:hypothetical protein
VPCAAAAPMRFSVIGSAAYVADHVSVFEHIFAEGAAICIWNRRPDEILDNYLQKSICSGAWERQARVDAAEPQLDELLMGFEDDVGRIRLVTELTSLIDLFATLSDAQTVGVRVTATQRAMCPRFHADHVGLRLLCTWIGEGTEWLAQEDVVREQLGHPRAGIQPAPGPMRPGAAVHRMSPFAVGVFKGDLWPGSDGRGAVHRSPQPTGWRVVMSLDAL